MEYTKEIVDFISEEYAKGESTANIALALEVSERSVIAKLSSLGLYKKKTYLNKQGEPPVKKEVYIERIAKALNANIELLESLEKVNKTVLIMIDKALKA